MKKYLFLIALIIISTRLLHAQNDISIPLKDMKDQWVKVNVKFGTVSVMGSSRSDVYVKWEPLVQEEQNRDKRKDGLKRISTGESGLEINQDNNIIEIGASSFTSGFAITIEVPKRINLDISTFNEGDVEVRNIQGDVTLESYNGQIEARQMSGSVVANTWNGDIVVAFDAIAPDTPMEFVTYNGKVDLTLPPDTQSTLKMRTKGGEILTGFDVVLKDAESMKSETEKNKEDGQIVYLDGWIYASINGDGPIFTLENNYGDILVRKGE